MSWTAIPDFNGKVIAYNVQWTFRDKDNRAQSGFSPTITDLSRLQYTITCLLPFNDYAITYTGINGGGESVRSDIVTVKTENISKFIT